MIFSLTGCTAVLKKEDIFLKAQKIKAAAVPQSFKTIVTIDSSTHAAPMPVSKPIIEPPASLEPLPPLAQAKLAQEEKLVYKAKFLGIAIGDFILRNKGKAMLNERPAYCFEIEVETLPFFTLLFKPKDRYVSYMDPETFVALRHEEYIKSGTLLESATEFDYTKHIATYKNFITNEEKKFPIPDKLVDVISGAYYLRMIPLAVGDTQEVELFADGKIYNFVGLVHSKTMVNMPNGTTQEALFFKPYVFLNGKQIKKISAEIFFSTNEIKTPLRANLKTPLGNVSVILVEDTKENLEKGSTTHEKT